jgi:cytoskeletal protein CcmA (bactofilin family)
MTVRLKDEVAQLRATPAAETPSGLLVLDSHDGFVWNHLRQEYRHRGTLHAAQQVLAAYSVTIDDGTLRCAGLAGQRVEMHAGDAGVRYVFGEDGISVTGGALVADAIASDGEIRLVAGQVNAGAIMSPCLACGPATVEAIESDDLSKDLTQRFDIKKPTIFVHRRLGPDTLIDSSLTCAGDLHMEAGAVIRGTVHVRGHLSLADCAKIEGNVVVDGDLRTGPHAAIGGCIVARGRVHLGEHTRVGAPGRRVTVLGSHIELSRGTVIYGGARSVEREGISFGGVR